MKPRIRRRFGIWCCAVLDDIGRMQPPMGHGYRPDQALREWVYLISSAHLARA